MSNHETVGRETSHDTASHQTASHQTDGVTFFFGVLFLLCAAAAIVLRTVPLGESADGGVAVAAAVVLLVAGVIGIGGSLRNRHPRVRRDAVVDGAEPVGTDDVPDDHGLLTDDQPSDDQPWEGRSSEGQPPKTWTT